ncbi:monocarboxylate transporter 13-like [Ambystoma mexicanum]|uniref:monocarboxylate transporter 13-like n=1 Tax=Ambystoma mexicanum TaxID=8296 RepID=UPI0037E94558
MVALPDWNIKLLVKNLAESVDARFGWALIFAPSLGAISNYFLRRRALALGLAFTGTGLSSFVFSPFFQALIDAYSWRGAHLILSAIMLNLCISGALLRPIPALEGTGQYDKEAQQSSRCSLLLYKLSSMLDLNLFRNRGFLVYSASMLLICTGYFVPYIHLVPHGKDLGLSNYEAAFVVSLMALADAVARLLSGAFADLKVLKTLHLLALWNSATGLTLLLLPVGATFPAMMTLGFIYGLSTGAFTPLSFAVLPDLVATERVTNATGLSLMVMSFGVLLGPPLSGSSSHSHLLTVEVHHKQWHHGYQRDASASLPRFTEAELSMLTDTIVEHAGEIFATDHHRRTQQRKITIWDEVAQKVSAVGTTPSTVRDCRKQWMTST